MRRRAGFTAPVLHSHLVSLAEFVGMYLRTWTRAVVRRPGRRRRLWGRRRGLRRSALGAPGPPGSYRAAVALAGRSREDVLASPTCRGCGGPWPTRDLHDPRRRRRHRRLEPAPAVDDQSTAAPGPSGPERPGRVRDLPGRGNSPTSSPGGPGGRLLEALAPGTARRARPRGDPPGSVRRPTLAAVGWDYQVDTPSSRRSCSTPGPSGASGRGTGAPPGPARPRGEAASSATGCARPREVPLTVVVWAAPSSGTPIEV